MGDDFTIHNPIQSLPPAQMAPAAGTQKTTAAESATPTAEPKTGEIPKAAVTPEQNREACEKHLEAGAKTYNEVSNNIWATLTANSTPVSPNKTNIQAKKEAFQEKYKDAIAELKKGGGWVNRKKEMEKAGKGVELQTNEYIKVNNPPPEKVSLQKFRETCKDFIIELTNEAAKEMGLPTCKGIIFGTPGYNSDIDLVIVPPPNMSVEHQVLFKNVADACWAHIFGDLSGIQGDLEIYTESPGLVLATEKRMMELQDRMEALGATKDTAEAGMRGFAYTELCMSVYELRRSFGTDNAGWEEESKRLLDTFNTPPELNKAYARAIGEINALHGQVSNDIMKLAGPNPSAEDLKRAGMLYKSNRMMVLAKDIDKVKKSISDLNKSIEDSPQKDKSAKLKDLQQLMHLENDLAKKFGLLYSMYDEAYLTQSAYIRTCEAIGGQKHKLEMEKGIPSNREKATEFQQLWGTREDGAKFNAKKEHYMKPGTPLLDLEHAAIDSAKYAMRITLGLAHAKFMQVNLQDKLKKMTPEEREKRGITGNIQTKIETLVTDSIKLHSETEQLEKCKRKVILNEVTFVAMAGETLKGKITTDQLKRVSKVFDYTVGTPSLKFEKGMAALAAETDALKTMSDKTPRLSRMGSIMKARAGFDRTVRGNEDLIPVHEDAEQVTLANFNMNSPEGIKKYTDKLQELSDTTLKYSIQLGFTPLPVSDPEQEDLLTMWQRTGPLPPKTKAEKDTKSAAATAVLKPATTSQIETKQKVETRLKTDGATMDETEKVMKALGQPPPQNIISLLSTIAGSKMLAEHANEERRRNNPKIRDNLDLLKNLNYLKDKKPADIRKPLEQLRAQFSKRNVDKKIIDGMKDPSQIGGLVNELAMEISKGFKK